MRASGASVDRLTAEHRELDRLFGALLAALESGDAEAARRAIEEFDDALRRHTRLEEEQVFPPRAEPGLAPAEVEATEARLYRELRLEHVQVRELSGMIRDRLASKSDLEAARHLAANLARRWDAHTTREERELGKRMSGLT